MKKIMFCIIMLLLTIVGASAVDDTWYGTGSIQGLNNRGQHQGSFNDTETDYQLTGSGSIGSSNVLIADFDGDSEGEFIFHSGGNVYYYESDWTQTDTNAHPHLGELALIDNACSGKPGALGWTPNQFRLYCISGGAIVITDTEPASLTVASEQGVSCGKDSHTHCIIPTNSGWTGVNVSTTIGTSVNHANTDIATYSQKNYTQNAPIADLDGDGALDIVFYCDNSTHTKVGIYDENGNTKVACKDYYSIDGTGDMEQYPQMILDNNYVLYYSATIGRFIAHDVLGTLRFTILPPYGPDPLSFVTGDFNNDGNREWGWLAEYLTGGVNNHNTFYCYTDTGTTALGCGADTAYGLSPNYCDYYATAADIDDDGYDEILACQSVFDGSAQKSITGLTSFDATATKQVADVNNDGYLDILDSRTGYAKLWTTTGYTPPPPPPSNSVPDVLSQTLNITRDPSDGYPMYVNISFTAYDDEGDNLTCITFRDYNSTLTDGHNINNLAHIDASQYYITTSGDGIVGNTDSKYQFTYNTSDTAYQLRTYCSDGNHTDFADMDYEQDYFIAYNSFTATDDMQVIVRDGTTNALISDAVIDIVNYERNGQEKVVQLTESGQTTFYDIPIGTYLIHASHPSYDGVDVACESYNVCNIYMNENLIGNLYFTLRDSQTFSLIPGVNASITNYVNEEEHSTITNNTGQAYFVNVTQGQYHASFSRTGYNTYSNFYNTGTGTNVIYLVATATGSTSATITVRDINTAEPIFSAYLFMYDLFSDTYYYGFTDQNGEVTFYDLNGNSNYQIEITDNDITETFNAYIVSGQNNEFEFLFGEEIESKYGYNNTQDIIKGIWISGVNKIKCDIDAECPTDKCNVMGTCSSFNYSYCDVNQRPRNQRCVVAGTFQGGMSAIADWMLSNFLWMLLIIIILVLVLMLLLGTQRR